MSALKDELASMIAHDGPISLERYMSLCLSHPRHGYYMTRDPFGPSGDFVTAPEISQMFGELIGVWMIEAWRAAGAPAKAHLVELGPGRGTLMSDILRVARIAPPFVEAMDVHLVETSPVLREMQRKTLEGAEKPVTWRDDFDEIPPGPVFVVANEFFDALPVRHFVNTIDGWRERLVGLGTEGQLTFGLAADAETALHIPAREGSIIEINPTAQRQMDALASRIAKDGGAALVVDYGYAVSSLGDSLQAVKAHAYVDPLAEPGEADLTAHVDFAALARAAKAAGAKVLGPAPQGDFLNALGIQQRAATLSRAANEAQKAGIVAALDRLTGRDDHKSQMGALFKAMAVVHLDIPALPGFPA